MTAPYALGWVDPPARLEFRYECPCGTDYYGNPLKLARQRSAAASDPSSTWTWPTCDECGGRYEPADSFVWVRTDSTIEDVRITPELAAEWLKLGRSVEGRSIPSDVEALANVMRAGEWVDVTMDVGGIAYPIVFDHQGYVRNGLQRLEAAMRADASFTATVIRWPHSNVRHVNGLADRRPMLAYPHFLSDAPLLMDQPLYA